MTKREFLRNHMRKLDRLEKVILLVLYVWFILRIWPGTFAGVELYVLLLLLSEGLVVVLLLIRKPTENISNRFRDWFVAFSGTLLPLLVSKGGAPLMPHVGGSLMFFGLLTHFIAKLSLFRSFGIVPADRGVKIKGLYSFVRHPMYAGYFCTHIGFLLVVPSLWNFTVYACNWAFLLWRIYAEERVLLQSPDYQQYKKRVRYRLIPGIF